MKYNNFAQIERFRPQWITCVQAIGCSLVQNCVNITLFADKWWNQPAELLTPECIPWIRNYDQELFISIKSNSAMTKDTIESASEFHHEIKKYLMTSSFEDEKIDWNMNWWFGIQIECHWIWRPHSIFNCAHFAGFLLFNWWLNICIRVITQSAYNWKFNFK